MGLTGAGISTLVSRILTFIVLCFICPKEKYKEFLTGFKNGVVNRLNLSNLIRLGFPVGLLMGVETGSFSLSVIMMGWIGAPHWPPIRC